MNWTEPPPDLDSPTAANLRAMREQHGVDSPEAQAAFDLRLAEVLFEEAMAPEPGLWWLSFADPDLPTGTQFLGALVIEAPGYMAAITLASMAGLNPGGEVQGIGPIPVAAIEPRWHNRLLTRAEVDEIDKAGPAG